MQGYQVSLPQSLMPYAASFKEDIESASAQQLRSLSLQTESAATACSNNSASLSAGASSTGPVCPSAPAYTNTDAIRSPASQAASPSTKTA
ncbi:unnamed protein product [Gadus morhua 'NCC']